MIVLATLLLMTVSTGLLVHSVRKRNKEIQEIIDWLDASREYNNNLVVEIEKRSKRLAQRLEKIDE